MFYLNKEELKDKILGCWIGKNIGGTMGTPYEGSSSMQDIQGFKSAKGEPLPNDDLDLQLIWLRAVEQEGPWHLSATVLSEYWLQFITPHWNEYGVGKSNLVAGFLPPMSGELNNEVWRHSNGAWIRSEIWACLAPGYPEIACRYAFMDASVDHGTSEGTSAELFTAALQSLAFRETDLRTLIDKSLAFISEDSRVFKSVKKVIELYDAGVDYRTAREEIVKMNSDLGWFQAPSNVAFVLIGLIYGEGDFKKSMIYSINCGDDTDCTGATVGAIMGIMYGAEKIPSDWREYIGDSIKSICIAPDDTMAATTCTKLTERVMRMIPMVFRANNVVMDFTDGETKYDENVAGSAWGDQTSVETYLFGLPDVREKFKFKRYSFEAFHTVHTDGYIEFEKKPEIAPGEEIELTLYMKNLKVDQRYAYINLHLPEGWSASYDRTVFIDRYYNPAHPELKTECKIKITAGEKVLPKNRIIMDIEFDSKATDAYATINILGK